MAFKIVRTETSKPVIHHQRDKNWEIGQLRNIIQRSCDFLRNPLCDATLSDFADSLFAMGLRIDSFKDVAWLLLERTKAWRVMEINRAVEEAWRLSDYDENTSNRGIFREEALKAASGVENGGIFLDQAEEICALINLLGSQGNWPLSSRGLTKQTAQNQAAREQRHQDQEKQERNRLIAKLTDNGQRGFTAIVPVGSDAAGWTTKKVSYNQHGQQLKLELQGFTKDGRQPIAGDGGFAAMPLGQIKKLHTAVMQQRQFESMDRKELAQATKNLRAGSDSVRFGEEMVQQQTKTNDDALFTNPQTGREYTRFEFIGVAKNDLGLFRKLIQRDRDRCNRILNQIV